jgi:hypothetical protein
MSVSHTSDPKVEPICVRVERILSSIEKSAGVKNSEMFRALMMDVVDRAHRMASRGPASLKRTKRIGQLVCKLQEALNDNPDLSQHLEHVQHLEYVSARLEYSDSLLTASKESLKRPRQVSNLADALLQTASALHWLERLKKNRRSGKWEERIRKQFVSGLLDATCLAGGDLGVNRRNGRGSLVEAVDLLKPHLPELFQDGLSASTLRIIKTAWLKNLQIVV